MELFGQMRCSGGSHLFVDYIIVQELVGAETSAAAELTGRVEARHFGAACGFAAEGAACHDLHESCGGLRTSFA